MKKLIKTISGRDVEMTTSQARELQRDGIVIVGDRIIRSAEYIRRVHEKGAAESITKAAKEVFQ